MIKLTKDDQDFLLESIRENAIVYGSELGKIKFPTFDLVNSTDEKYLCMTLTFVVDPLRAIIEIFHRETLHKPFRCIRVDYTIEDARELWVKLVTEGFEVLTP
jgi:hypothetical protein